jgi:hypothetical protein
MPKRDRLCPDSRASPGEKTYAQTTAPGKRWTVTVTVKHVDEAKREIHLTTVLPWALPSTIILPVSGSTLLMAVFGLA